MAKYEAQEVRRIIREELKAFFSERDLISNDSEVGEVWESIKESVAFSGPFMVRDVLDSYRQLKNNEKENN